MLHKYLLPVMLLASSFAFNAKAMEHEEKSTNSGESHFTNDEKKLIKVLMDMKSLQQVETFCRYGKGLVLHRFKDLTYDEAIQRHTALISEIIDLTVVMDYDRLKFISDKAQESFYNEAKGELILSYCTMVGE